MPGIRASTSQASGRRRTQATAAPESDDESQTPARGGAKVKIEPEFLNNVPEARTADLALRTIIGNWKSIGVSLESSMVAVKDAAADYTEAYCEDPEEAEEAEEQFDKEMRSLVDKVNEAEIRMKSAEQLRTRIHREQITNIMEEYENFVQEGLQNYQNKTARQKYGQNQEYRAFRERLWEVRNSDQGMPALNTFLPKEDGDESDEDEIEIGGQTQSFKCPLSLTTLVEPMRRRAPFYFHAVRCLFLSLAHSHLAHAGTNSKVCRNHYFSRSLIEEYVRSHGGSVECPVAGCSSELTMSQLVLDKDMERRVKTHERNAEKTQQTQAYVDLDEDDD